MMFVVGSELWTLELNNVNFISRFVGGRATEPSYIDVPHFTSSLQSDMTSSCERLLV